MRSFKAEWRGTVLNGTVVGCAARRKRPAEVLPEIDNQSRQVNQESCLVPVGFRTLDIEAADPFDPDKSNRLPALNFARGVALPVASFVECPPLIRETWPALAAVFVRRCWTVF